MAADFALEQQLQTLIAEYRRLRSTVSTLKVRLAEQDQSMAQLNEDNQRLRATIDELNVDRFSLKRLKDERKTLRRKLTMALDRLESLETEVSRVVE